MTALWLTALVGLAAVALLLTEVVRLNRRLEHTHEVAHAALDLLRLHISGADIEIISMNLRQDPEE